MAKPSPPKTAADRTGLVAFRLSPAERAKLDAAAEAAGLTLSGYARRVLLDAPALRRAKRPAVEKAALSRLLGELGKIGSNLNQLAHVGNTGRDVDGAALASALGDLADLRTAIFAALGREP